MVSVGGAFAQTLPQPTRVWSVGPLTKGRPVVGVVIGAGSTALTAPHVDTQTGSVFSATRSVVFAGDRIVLASMVGMRRVEGSQIPEASYDLLSLDALTGDVKEIAVSTFGSLSVFATDDAHVIVSGRSVMRLTPDLKDAGGFDYRANGHKSGNVQNISPDGSTLSRRQPPAEGRSLTLLPIVDTAVGSKAVVSDSRQWIKDYPKAKGFVTLTDEQGQHLIFGDCGGRPRFW